MLTLVWLLCPLRAIAADLSSDPAAPVVRLHTRFLELHRDNAPQTGLAAMIEEVFDMPQITRAVLGKSAGAVSPEQFVRLQAALTQRMVRETQRLRPDTPDDGFTILETRSVGDANWLVITRSKPVSPSSEPAVLSWRVVHTDQGPRIVDVLRDGISAVTTQRDDLVAAMRRRDLDTVILEMERHQAR